jgi:choline monooxygenase
MSSLPHAPETLPADWYRGQARWPLERAAIFARSWNVFTHDSALPAPGAWVAQTIAGYPLIVVRGEDGVLRAFHNVCRHRAGPLTEGSAGTCANATLTCRYHGWRYTLDGRLRAARDFGPAENFDPRDYGLFPAHLAVWRGLIFVTIDKPQEDLDALLAPLEARLAGRDWGDLKLATSRHHPLACNWKTYVENYLEGYHIPNMHPSLDAEVDSTRYRVDIEGRIAFHDAPSKEAEGVYDGLFAWIWPNWAINVYKTGLMIERMSPVDARSTQLDYLYLMPDGQAPTEATLAMSETVTAEDKWIVERVQENLDAGVYATGRLSPRHEAGVAAFQAWVRQAAP